MDNTRQAMLTMCGGVAVLASVTTTVKVYVPVVVGLPEMAPELLSLRPGGREPEPARCAHL